jgi:hypothetical protein
MKNGDFDVQRGSSVISISFKNDIPNVEGKIVKEKDYKYNGDIKNWKREGYGKCKWNDGKTYEGEW